MIMTLTMTSIRIITLIMTLIMMMMMNPGWSHQSPKSGGVRMDPQQYRAEPTKVSHSRNKTNTFWYRAEPAKIQNLGTGLDPQKYRVGPQKAGLQGAPS